jgi:cell division protease FtsH
MKSRLKQYTADHRYLLEVVARQAGFAAPVAIDLDDFTTPVLKAARKGELLSVDGVLVRDWDPDNRRIYPGIRLGMRVYTIDGVRLVRVRFGYNDQQNGWGLDFVAVDRKDYRRFYRIALRCRRDFEPPSQPPVLPPEQAEQLWKNTIGYLDRGNLRRIRSYGGRAKRGVLLTGAPGNGKTMACRWIWEECRRRRWDWRLVTPDAYRQARATDSIEQLFTVERRGVIFFDDMDLALRDRETVHETEDQAVFLSALDGISINEGVVFVFTTNCSLELIDQAFKRPGRLDLVLHFKSPDAGLRRRLVARWHQDIRTHLDVEAAVASTEGYTFAEIEELKNLLIMRFMECGDWDWSWALDQFDINRKELSKRQLRRVGFGAGDKASALNNGK